MSSLPGDKAGIKVNSEMKMVCFFIEHSENLKYDI